MKISIIGSGSWGTALALTSHRAGNEVNIWSRNHDIALEINQNHSNNKYLPNIILPKDITATNNLSDIIDSDILLLVVPAQNIRQLCENLKNNHLPKNKLLIACSKGIEQNSLKLMSEVIEEILPENPIAILSGPNFAYPIAENLPAISSLAIKNSNKELAKQLSSTNFRVYPNEDILGTQVVGAAKNVLAIATGIVMGKNLGENAKAALISRGIYEINNLSLAKGGNPNTLLTPAGFGDILLTCSSSTSRNTSYGIALAQGNIDRNNLIEGFYSSGSISSLAKSLNVDMPICEAVYKITHKQHPLDEVIKELLDRPIRIS